MLSPYTVLDLTNDRGELAAMILGDLGADVIKVEPPEGSTSRRMGPFVDDAPELERSLHYYAFNRNKRGITLNLDGEEGKKALLALAAKADFVIESGHPGEMSRKGVGFEAMRRANPRIVYVAITPFGQDGPYAEFAASDLTIAAMGGPMSLQGVASRAPVRLSVPQVWLHASSEAAVAALTAHARMLQDGEAQFVDVSAQTAMVWTMLNGVGAHPVQGHDFQRSGSDVPFGAVIIPLVYECADGYMVLITSGATMVTAVQWLVADGIVPEEWIKAEDWPTYERRLLQGGEMVFELDEVVDAMRRFVRPYTKAELLERGLAENVTLAPVSTMEDLTRFRQLEERGYWISAPLPNGGQVDAPGLFNRLSGVPMNVRFWPPTLGQHNSEILGERLGMAAAEISLASGLDS